MSTDYLHTHKEFPQLLNIIAEKMGVIPQLVEKDYWIMHVLYGLKKQGFEFQLNGGTSLSKGYKIIDRFSEDIDIHIQPSSEQNVETNPKKIKPSHVQSRAYYYDWLSKNIRIDGIVSIKRDLAFDDEQGYFRSGGIRLLYKSVSESVGGVKEGILLEVGFDTVTPNTPLTISSWTFDKANSTKGIEIIDNRASDIACYHLGYTFVEKLQTVATKFRQEQETRIERPNLMRQYYDLYSLLNNEEVKRFIGTEEYKAHKDVRFNKTDKAIQIAENEAYKLSDPEIRARFTKRYKTTAKLYYNGQPDFDAVLGRIHEYLDQL